jgi:hypothetical protein
MEKTPYRKKSYKALFTPKNVNIALITGAILRVYYLI